MKNITCDMCDTDISGEHYEIFIDHIDEDENEEIEEETYQFCCTRCMGKWMVEQARDEYGVFNN